MHRNNISISDFTSSSQYVILDNVEISTDSQSSILSSSTEVSSSDCKLTRVYSPNALVYTSDTTSELSHIETTDEETTSVISHSEEEEDKVNKNNTVVVNMLPQLPKVELIRQLRLNDFRNCVEKDIGLVQTKNVTSSHKRICSGELSDVKIIIGTEKFNCQHALLAAFSKYFSKKVYNYKYKLPIEEVTPKAFEQIYAWILQDDSEQSIQYNVVDVLQAATYLEVTSLTKQLWYYIDSNSYYTEFNAFMLFLEARDKPLGSLLEELMLQRITKSFLTFLTTNEFLQLSLKHLKVLFKSDSVAVNTEKEVFYAAILWLTYNWSERQRYMIEVLRCTRMQLLPMTFLNELKRPSMVCEVNCIIKTEEFQKYLSDVIFSHSINFYCLRNKNIGNICDGLNITKPMPRLFIYDNNSLYHKKNPNARQANVSYNDFMKYLKVLQTMGQNCWKSLKVEHIQEYRPC